MLVGKLGEKKNPGHLSMTGVCVGGIGLGWWLKGSLTIEDSFLVEPILGRDIYPTALKLFGYLMDTDIVHVGFGMTPTNCTSDLAVSKHGDKLRG
jgi:hypothetical protein